MNKTTTFILAAFALLLSGCDWLGIRGNGHIVTDQRPISEFTEIENRISGNTLRLHTRDRIRPTHGITVSVSSAKLNGADLSGAVDLIAKQVPGPKFYVRARGASDITIDGSVEEFLADMTGASDLKAKGLQAKTIEISTTGAASAYVSVTDTLRVSITGAGDVTYYGNPKTIEKHIIGAGSIRHKD